MNAQRCSYCGCLCCKPDSRGIVGSVVSSLRGANPDVLYLCPACLPKKPKDATVVFVDRMENAKEGQ